jgi:hypothetical protein
MTHSIRASALFDNTADKLGNPLTLKSFVTLVSFVVKVALRAGEKECRAALNPLRPAG